MKTVMIQTRYRHFQRNGGLNQISMAPNLPLSLRFKGSGCHIYIITVFTTTLEQNRYNSSQRSTKFSEEGGTSIVNHLRQQPRVTWSILTTKVNVKNTFTSHIDKHIFDIVVDFLIFTHFHFMKFHRLLSSLQRQNIFRQDLRIGI